MWRSQAIAAAVILGASPAEACSVNRFTAYFGMNHDIFMTVDSGKACVRALAVHSGALEEMAIASPAANGEARARVGSYAYRSKPGFKGQDRFVVRVRGHDPRSRGTSLLTVHVTVR